MKLRLLFLILMTAAWPLAADEVSCLRDVARVMIDKPVKVSLAEKVEKANQVLKRELTAKQGLVVHELGDTSSEIYTAKEVAIQNRKLAKVGFSDQEIAKLRKSGVLGNSVLSMANGSPKGVVVHQLAVRELDGASLKELRGEKKFNYLIGEDGHVYVTKKPLDLPSDKIVIATREGEGPPVVVREAGELSYSKGDRGFAFKPSYGFDTSEMEEREIVNGISAFSPGSTVKYKASSAVPHSRVFKCLDILSAQSGGKNFILDRMLSENLVTTTAILGSEAAGAGRLKTAEGRSVVYADIIGANVNGLIGSTIARHLVIRDSSFITSMGVRTGMGLGMIEVQKQVHGAIIEDNAQEEAAKIAAFNRAHFIARLPINHYFDQFVVKNLPTLLFNSCQRNPGLSMMLSPRAVRLYERYGSATLYFGLRQAIVGE